jgi:hypothetical protein
MPELQLIIIELGQKNLLLNVDDNSSINQLFTKIYKSKCISKNKTGNYDIVYNGDIIQPSELPLKNISIKNLSQIEIKEKGNKEMEKGKDDWKDGIINGSKSLVYNTIDEELFIRDSLKQKVSKKIKNKLYIASQDGDTAKIFHSKCDNKGPLLYLIKTTNNVVFAIYVSKPICSDGITRNDSTQMVICPYKKFAILSLDGNSTYHCNANNGALFHCMQLNTPFLSSNCVDIYSCTNFNLPSYPSGNSNYQIKELEVYSLEDAS